MAQPARETLSLEALFDLFHRTTPDPGRWLGLADSLDTLAVVTYVVIRNQRGG